MQTPVPGLANENKSQRFLSKDRLRWKRMDPSLRALRESSFRRRACAGTLGETIGFWLPEDTRLGLIRESGLADIHPPILREVVLLSPRRTLSGWSTIVL